MINQIHVKGFKSFKDLPIPFKPLTVLCGTNGSGKSSVMQLLLLLKAYALEADRSGNVVLKNEEFNLGRMSDIVYRWSSKREIDISFNTSMGKYDIVSLDGSSEDDFVTFQVKEGDFASDSLVEFFENNVHYLSSDRLAPQSMHNNSAYAVRTRDIGRHGENAVAIFYAHGQDEIPRELCHEGTENKRSLGEQVNAWLADVSHGVAVQTMPVGEFLKLEVDYGSAKVFNKGFRPENVGFGISYVLPVLVMILSAKKGDCLLIENPGAQLHPQGQAQIGRLLAKAAAYGIQIVIETHSDHVVNGIRVGCKKRADEHREECNEDGGVLYYNGAIIHFFERVYDRTEGVDDALQEQYTNITPIRIEARGEFERYPDYFLDEWPRQLAEMA